MWIATYPRAGGAGGRHSATSRKLDGQRAAGHRVPTATRAAVRSARGRTGEARKRPWGRASVRDCDARPATPTRVLPRAPTRRHPDWPTCRPPIGARTRLASVQCGRPADRATASTHATCPDWRGPKSTADPESREKHRNSATDPRTPHPPPATRRPHSHARGGEAQMVKNAIFLAASPVGASREFDAPAARARRTRPISTGQRSEKRRQGQTRDPARVRPSRAPACRARPSVAEAVGRHLPETRPKAVFRPAPPEDRRRARSWRRAHNVRPCRAGARCRLACAAAL
jgi:hypothetical protein